MAVRMKDFSATLRTTAAVSGTLTLNVATANSNAINTAIGESGVAFRHVRELNITIEFGAGEDSEIVEAYLRYDGATDEAQDFAGLVDITTAETMTISCEPGRLGPASELTLFLDSDNIFTGNVTITCDGTAVWDTEYVS